MSKQIYSQIFFSTTKYVLLRNFFMIITGIVSIFIVRLLGPQEYGKYSLVWQLISTVGPILSLGWLSTLAKFIPEKTDIKEKSSLLFLSLISVSISGIIFFITINFVKKFFPQVLPLEIKEIIFVFSLFIILVAFFNVLEGFWRGLGKFNKFAVIDGLRSNVGNMLGLFLIFYFGTSYKTIVKSNFFVSLVFLVFLMFLIRNYIWVASWNIIKIEKQIINFCLTFLLGQVVYMLSVNLDILLLRSMLKDPQQVGYYTSGIRIPKLIETMFIAHLPAPILYYFSSNEIAYLKEKIFVFSSKILSFLFSVVSLVCFSFSDYIILFLFSGKFKDSIVVFKYFSLSLPFLAYGMLFSTYYLSENKPHIPLIFHFFTMVLLFNLLNLFLIPKYKFFAPVISYLIALVVFLIILSLYCFKKYKINLISVFFLFIFLFLAVVLEKVSNVKLISLPGFILACFITKIITLEEILKSRSVLIKEKINTNLYL
ncbi:MAG: oligosaccharide flippase family protein [Endomicrobiia bacterium]